MAVGIQPTDALLLKNYPIITVPLSSLGMTKTRFHAFEYLRHGQILTRGRKPPLRKTQRLFRNDKHLAVPGRHSDKERIEPGLSVHILGATDTKGT